MLLRKVINISVAQSMAVLMLASSTGCQLNSASTKTITTKEGLFPWMQREKYLIPLDIKGEATDPIDANKSVNKLVEDANNASADNQGMSKSGLGDAVSIDQLNGVQQCWYLYAPKQGELPINFAFKEEIKRALESNQIKKVSTKSVSLGKLVAKFRSLPELSKFEVAMSAGTKSLKDAAEEKKKEWESNPIGQLLTAGGTLAFVNSDWLTKRLTKVANLNSVEAATAQASKAVEVLQDAVQKAESNQKLATKSGPVIDKIAKANWAKAAGKKSAKLGIQLQDSCFRSGNEMMRQACTFAVLGVVSWGMFSAASTYIRLAGTGTEDKVSLAQLDPEHFAEFTKKVGDLEQLVSMNPKEFEAISAVPENGKPGGAIYQLSREGSETCLEPAQVAKKYK